LIPLSGMIKKVLFILFLFAHYLLNAQVSEKSTSDFERSKIEELFITLYTNSVLNENDTVLITTKDGRFRAEQVIVRFLKHIPVFALKTGRLLPELSMGSIFDVMKIRYEPMGGIFVNETFVFCKPYTNSLHNTISSNDGNFTAWIEHYFTGIYPDSFYAHNVSSPDSMLSAYNGYYNNLMNMFAGNAVNNYLTRISKDERNMHYFYTARDHLIDIAGKYKTDYRNQFSMKDLEKNVKFITGKNGQLPFNADKAIRYRLPVKPVNGDVSFPKKYSNCEVLILHKQDLGPVIFYCFFTKDGYKKRDDYFAMLEKAFVFK